MVQVQAQKTIKLHKNGKHHEYNIGDMVYIDNGNKLNRKNLDNLKKFHVSKTLPTSEVKDVIYD